MDVVNPPNLTPLMPPIRLPLHCQFRATLVASIGVKKDQNGDPYLPAVKQSLEPNLSSAKSWAKMAMEKLTEKEKKDGAYVRITEIKEYLVTEMRPE